MNDFVKVFDLADSGFRSIGFASFGFIFIGIGLIMFFSPQLLKKLNFQKTQGETKYQKFFRFFFLAFALFWTGTALISTYGEYSSLRDADCKIVEGKVENFDPMPYSGHKDETYSVKGVTFSYSDYGVTNGFNHTASHGGPVNQDSFVRICYLPKGNTNIITRLEVKGYKGPIEDYSSRFDLFDQFKHIEKDRKSGKFGKEMMSSDKSMVVATNYMFFIMPMFIADYILYVLFIIPFFNLFFKVRVIEHELLEIDNKYLDQEKHTFENLTVKYDGEGVLWGRPYGIEIMNSPGSALKMYLSQDRTKIIRSEIRMSSLMFLTLFSFAIAGIEFFSVVMTNTPNYPEGMKYFPYVMFPMIVINFWMLKARFQKKVDQFFININSKVSNRG